MESTITSKPTGSLSISLTWSGAFADPRTKRHGLSLIRSIDACHLARRRRVADVIFIAKTRRCKTPRLWPSCHEPVMTRTKRHGFCGSSVRNVTAFADLWTVCMDELQETLPHFPLFSRDGKGAPSSPRGGETSWFGARRCSCWTGRRRSSAGK